MRFTDYLSKIESGLCVECGEKLPDGCDTISCPRCLDIKRELRRASREAMKAKGKCSCGRSTDGKHAYCDPCRAKARRYAAASREHRAAAHKCVRCGKPMDTSVTTRRCEACKEYIRIHDKRKKGAV